ncbi:MAG: transcriptional regulator GcvA [Rhodospirillaceae bacterium]|jgi:LysR family glycine cleavage system transcriptional activator|nr:transcriptional regulator GcvA [Rhodospirillaceae bacterium]MBT5943182.1 transcriptional regulator GcvA [Rhodospirillaceae bacterium]MBT6403856.1 transcriptional regulator GcvA [Rhodospirillaceae bacterium]MBT6536210.1 transcriptional regulator GcvA [Rhodospirillaceae bacterium]MBT7362079.1 transcriptional regulator GcvA [Rhodospirillaceae bacterium]
MYDLPPLNGLRAFEAAARNLSFAKAAEELHVTPAAVSYQVRALETKLGVKLFRRLNRAVVLTDAGAQMFPGVRSSFEGLHRTVARVGSVARSDRVVTATISPHMAAKWLVPRLTSFIERHPDIDLRIAASNTVVDLDTDRADVAIRYNLGNNAGLVAEKLMDEAVTPMCVPELLDGSHPIRIPADLRHHTLIHDDTLSRHWPDAPAWSKWLTLAHQPLRDEDAGLHFDHSDHCMDAALMGSGVMLGRRAMASRDIELGRLVAPFELDLPFEGGIYSVTTQEKASNPDVAAFRDWLREEAAAMRMGLPPGA